MGRNFHESFVKARVEMGSNRSFGLVMAAACCIIGGLGFWWESAYWPYWLLAGGIFLGAALLFPRALTPLNRIWFLLGLTLHRIVSPLIMGILFFLIITPIGLLMRLFGKRPLGLKFQNDESYWIVRDQHAPQSMSKQY